MVKGLIKLGRLLVSFTFPAGGLPDALIFLVYALIAVALFRWVILPVALFLFFGFFALLGAIIKDKDY